MVQTSFYIVAAAATVTVLSLETRAWVLSPPIIESSRLSSPPTHSLLSAVSICTDLGGTPAEDRNFARTLSIRTTKNTQSDVEQKDDTPLPEEPLVLMRQWASSRSIEGAQKAQELLLQLETEQPHVLTNKHYTVVLDAHGLAGDVEKARGVLQRMMEKAEHNAAIAPSQVTINVMLHAYARQNDIQSAKTLLFETRESGTVRIRTVDYNVVLNLLAKQGEFQEAQQVLSLCPEPNMWSYNSLIEAYAKSSHLMVRDVQDMNQVLQQLKSSEDKALHPSSETFAYMIQALTVHAETCESPTPRPLLVKQAQDLFQESILANGDNKPTSALLLAMMNLYASLKEAGKAQDLLNEYGDFLTKGDHNQQKATVAYNTLLKALKNSPAADALQQSERVLNQMQEQGLANILSYTTYLSTLASHIGRHQPGQQQDALAQKAQQLLSDLKSQANNDGSRPRPNSLTFNSVLHCWSASGNLARAEQLLAEMEQSVDYPPTISSYTTLMSGWVKSDRNNKLDEMQILMRRALAQYKKGNKACKPNQFAYTTLIHALAGSKTVENARKAEQLLKLMYDEYKSAKSNVKGPTGSEHVIPNTRLVTSVIDCWKDSGSSDAGLRAESLINWMIKSGDSAMMPNAHSFSSAISAWARTRESGKASRARRLLVKMSQLHQEGLIDASPNSFCYTNVINSCAYCIQEEDEKKLSLQIAVQTYKEILKSKTSNPNYVTFSTFLTALRNLSPAGSQRTNAVRTVFKTAIQLGQVHPLVIKKVQAALTDQQDFAALIPASYMQNGQVQVQQLPKEWTQNVQ